MEDSDSEYEPDEHDFKRRRRSHSPQPPTRHAQDLRPTDEPRRESLTVAAQETDARAIINARAVRPPSSEGTPVDVAAIGRGGGAAPCAAEGAPPMLRGGRGEPLQGRGKGRGKGAPGRGTPSMPAGRGKGALDRGTPSMPNGRGKGGAPGPGAAPMAETWLRPEQVHQAQRMMQQQHEHDMMLMQQKHERELQMVKASVASAPPPTGAPLPPTVERDDDLDRALAHLQESTAAKGAAESSDAAAPNSRAADAPSPSAKAPDVATASKHMRPAPAPLGGMEGSTVIVNNIPPERCDVDSINSHFRQFGRVLNIKVQANRHSAVIEFSERAEAVLALDSADFPFGEPNVAVRWGKGGSGGKGGGGKGGGGKGGGGKGGGGKGGGGKGGGRGRGSRGAVPERPPPSDIVGRLGAQARDAMSKTAAAKPAALARRELDDRLREKEALFAKIDATPKDERPPLVKQLKELSAIIKTLLEAAKAAKSDAVS